MLNSFLRLSSNFKNNKINLINRNLNELITKYEFLYVQTISDLEHNQKICQNIKESKVVIISQNKKHNQNSIDKYFIISFQRTILLINLSSLSIFHSFFSKNTDLQFYYLSDTEDFFGNFPKGSLFDPFFLEEIESFNQELNFQHYQQKLIIAWSIIKSCISGYLIKQSYIKIKKNRIQNFSSFSQTKEKKFLNEDKFIYLRLIEFSNGFKVNLFYYIEKEELVVIKQSNSIDSETKKLKKREFENYLKINHPFLPNFYGIIAKENNIVIEFINGPNLLNIKDLNLTDDEKFTIIFEIMITVQFLHQNNFIVRDLKPNNVMVDEYKNAVLIDFDRMLNMNEDHLEFSNQFSSPFIAPEVNSGNFSYKCDIYSIGLMIYFIILERIPIAENLEKCLEFEDYPELFKIFKNCSRQNPKNRKQLSKLVFSFFINYYSKIKIENIFAKFEDYFSNIYEKNELDILKNITLDDNSDALFSTGLLYLEGKRFSYNINKAIKFFILSADKNNEKAQIYLGQIFEEEKEHKDIEKAIKYYTLAANQENENAMYKLGCIFEYYIKDITKAIEYYTLAANENHIKAQFDLGCIYEEGRGIQENISKAIHYFTFAANQNDIQSLIHLGKIFFNGKKIKQDLEKSIHYFTLASNLDNDNAQFLLGHIYENVINPPDYKKAIKYYTLSANKNNISAMYILGLMYEEGIKVEKDIYKAIHYYSLGAELNDKKFQYKLGYIYETIIKPPNINKAIEYYTYSADQNYCLAQVRLGDIYYNEVYFRRDIERAYHYYMLAAKQNNPEAQCQLGYIYEFGINDMKKALYFYQCSANQNYKPAMFKLGFFYLEGKFVPRDVEKATQYINSSKLVDSIININFQLGNKYFEGENCSKNIEKAIYFYKIASKQNFIGAQIKLGNIYNDGIFVPRDIDKAIYYFKLAADNNDYVAKYNLGVIYSKEIDVEKGIYYYNSIPEENNIIYPYAQYNIGCIYFHGRGKIQKDIKKAINYFMNSARYKFPDSLYNLGTIYYHGEFMEKNIEKAIYYYGLASKQDFTKAHLALGIIYYNDFDENQKFIQKGIYLLNLAAKKECYGSYFFVGYIYHEGHNVKRDIHKAIHFYKEASNFNSLFAKNNLGVIYKNGFGNEVEKNVFFAIEYFKEAIKLSDSVAPTFNLASLYFYEDPFQNSIDEAIKLLIKGALKKNIPSILLLCLAMVKKFANDFKSMENELIKYTGEISIFPYFIVDTIKSENYIIKSVYEESYQNYKLLDLIYKTKGIISLIEFNQIEQYKDESNAIDITSDFYEGFGF